SYVEIGREDQAAKTLTHRPPAKPRVRGRWLSGERASLLTAQTMPYRTAYHPKGTPRYGTAPTGTLGMGPAGQAVPRGTVHLCPWPKVLQAAVPFGCPAWYPLR